MTPKKEPRAEAAAEKYAATVGSEEAEPGDSYSTNVFSAARGGFMAGVSWKEANPTPQATDAKMPPRVYLLLWHCLSGGAYSKVRSWAGKLYFSDKPKGRSKFRKEQLTEYLSLIEHTELLSQARAEAREKGYEEGILFLITEMNESKDQDILRALYKLKARAEKWMAAKKAKAPVEPAKAAGSPNGAGGEAVSDLAERIKVTSEEVTPRYQVKFWSDPAVYRAFTDRCDSLGYKYGPTIIEFMKWFAETHPEPVTPLGSRTPRTAGEDREE